MSSSQRPPTDEALVGVKACEAFLRVEGKDFFQEPGRLGAGAGEGGVDRAKNRREGVGLVKLTADLPAPRADGEQMDELLVLLRRSVHGEQVLQGGGIEVCSPCDPPLKALERAE